MDWLFPYVFTTYCFALIIFHETSCRSFEKNIQVFSCFQQTWLQRSPDLLCLVSDSYWYSNLACCFPKHQDPMQGMWDFLSVGGDAGTEITDQQVLLSGDLRDRQNLDITHMLAESFSNEHVVELSTHSTWRKGNQVNGSLIGTDVTNDQFAGHGKANILSSSSFVCAPAMSARHFVISSTRVVYMTTTVA